MKLKIYNIQSVQNEQAPILELEIDGLFKEDSKPFFTWKTKCRAIHSFIFWRPLMLKKKNYKLCIHRKKAL